MSTAVPSSEDRPLRRRTGLIVRNVGGEGVVLDPDGGKVLGVNGVGIYLLEHLSTPHRVSELVAAVCARYAAASDEVERDVEAFVEDLFHRGLLEVEP